MSSLLYIGIDPATKCGWAKITSSGERLDSGVWNLERRRGDGAGMLYVRFDRLFREVVEASPGAVVAYEQQSNRFIGSAHVGLGIIAHLQRACEELSVPYTGVTYSTIKKLATGSGVAKKEAMVAAALKRWPELPADTTDDEADALWSAECARTGMV